MKLPHEFTDDEVEKFRALVRSWDEPLEEKLTEEDIRILMRVAMENGH